MEVFVEDQLTQDMVVEVGVLEVETSLDSVGQIHE